MMARCIASVWGLKPNQQRSATFVMLPVFCGIFVLWCAASSTASADEPKWLPSIAHEIPKETTSEGSGYFALVPGKNGKLYIGTAKYQLNAYLVEFDPKSKKMTTVVDCQKEIGTTATGFAAQAKIHTRNNVGESGKIYFGTKQGYPLKNESRIAYPGGYPLVYDPTTSKTEVYPIPIPHQGIISVTPDESRNVAYISTCSDERPIESAHFMILDLKTGKYRDLIDSRHMYAFIVVDHLGRAYHPMLGGDILRYDPRTDKLERLRQTIDGAPPTKESYLADPQSHPINWEISLDRKTLFAIAMSRNQLYSYDLTQAGDVLNGKSLGELVGGNVIATDCRAMCVATDGTVWAGVNVKHADKTDYLHIVSYRIGEKTPVDHGAIYVTNPQFTQFVDAKGKPLPIHHGFYKHRSGKLVPRFVVMAICATPDAVYATTLAPFTLHEFRNLRPSVASKVTPMAAKKK